MLKRVIGPIQQTRSCTTTSQLNEAEKKSILQMLKTFLKERKENSEPISMEQYNKEPEASERQIEGHQYAGRTGKRNEKMVAAGQKVIPFTNW